MKKIFYTLVVAFGLGVSLPVPDAFSAPDKDQVTQGELARSLVNVVGLRRFLATDPSEQACCRILQQNGCEPENGWKPPEVVTRAVLARVLVQAMGMADDVKNPSDPKSWIAVLQERGVPIDSVGSALENLPPAVEPIAENVFDTTTDPLEKKVRSAFPDEKTFGTDATHPPILVTEREVEEIIEEVVVPRRPRVVTPD